MEDFATVHEIAVLWSLSVRQVQRMCAAKMIPGIVLFGNAWAIPKTAQKPMCANRMKPWPIRGLTDVGRREISDGLESV
jgi:hypothetical protein